jgi:hypothetical protein
VHVDFESYDSFCGASDSQVSWQLLELLHCSEVDASCDMRHLACDGYTAFKIKKGMLILIPTTASAAFKPSGELAVGYNTL